MMVKMTCSSSRCTPCLIQDFNCNRFLHVSNSRDCLFNSSSHRNHHVKVVGPRCHLPHYAILCKTKNRSQTLMESNEIYWNKMIRHQRVIVSSGCRTVGTLFWIVEERFSV